jgi:hypothetical protein
VDHQNLRDSPGASVHRLLLPSPRVSVAEKARVAG